MLTYPSQFSLILQENYQLQKPDSVHLNSVAIMGFTTKFVLQPIYRDQFYLIQMLKEQSTKLNSTLQITLLTPIKNSLKQLASPQSSPSKSPSSAKVVGNYLLGKNLGQGTFGKVHLAMHIPTGQKVAIKIIDKSKMRAKDVERVKSQIRILTSTRHRHLIHLYQILQTQKSLLLVMQYMMNGELFRHIIKQKKIDQDRACRFFQQIVSAIEYLHTNGIAHRDLKPENILIDYDYQLKVIDFGLSTFYQNNQQLKTYCGSPCYAAPEIIQAKKSYNPVSADVWSCGIVLFAMICGYLPFCDADTHTLYKKVMACSFKIPPYVSASARNLIQNLLVFNPSKRLAFAEIRSHEWFNRVNPAPCYGITQYQTVTCDSAHLQRVKQLGFSEQKISESLSKNERNKQTAAYFILMKKVVKEGVFIPSYIGDDNFNPKTIQKIEDKQEDDTHSLSDPLSQQLVIKIPEAPSMQGEPCEQQPTSQSAPDQWWNIGQRQTDIKNIDPAESISVLTTNILDSILPSIHNNKQQKIKEIISPIAQESRVQKLVAKNKQAIFYANNPDHRKRKVNLHQGIVLPKESKDLAKSKSMHVQSDSDRKVTNITAKICNSIPQGSSLKRKIQSALKNRNSRSRSKHYHRIQSILPYLPITKSLKKNQQRFKNSLILEIFKKV